MQWLWAINPVIVIHVFYEIRNFDEDEEAFVLESECFFCREDIIVRQTPTVFRLSSVQIASLGHSDGRHREVKQGVKRRNFHLLPYGRSLMFKVMLCPFAQNVFCRKFLGIRREVLTNFLNHSGLRWEHQIDEWGA